MRAFESRYPQFHRQTSSNENARIPTAAAGRGRMDVCTHTIPARHNKASGGMSTCTMAPRPNSPIKANAARQISHIAASRRVGRSKNKPIALRASGSRAGARNAHIASIAPSSPPPKNRSGPKSPSIVRSFCGSPVFLSTKNQDSKRSTSFKEYSKRRKISGYFRSSSPAPKSVNARCETFSSA